MLPVPPVAVVYHIRFVPVAVSAVAGTPGQYVTGDTTVGAAGMATAVIVPLSEAAAQPPEVVTV